MNNIVSKFITIVAAALFVISFLNMKVIMFYDEYGLTGLDILQHADDSDAPIWPKLFVTIPFLVAVIRLILNVSSLQTYYIAIANSLLMGVPFAALFSQGDFEMGIGLVTCFLCAGAMIGIACATDYRKESKPASDGNTQTPTTTAPQTFQVRKKYNEEQIRQIVANPSMYNAQFVEACQKELEIRKEAEAIIQEVYTYTDDRIKEILASAATYSDALVFCCQKVKTERNIEKKKEEARKQAEEAQRLQREAQEKSERRSAWWKKNRIYFLLAFLAIIALLIMAYLHSDGRQYSKGLSAYEQGDYAEAATWLSKVSNSYEQAPNANWMLYQSYDQLNDSANAAAALVNATMDNDWSKHPDAYMLYARHLVYGSYEPYIKIDEKKAAALMATSLEEGWIRLAAGELYFRNMMFEDAYNCIANFSATSSPDALNKRANAYMGLFHLFGVGGVERNIDKAIKYFDASSYDEGIADYMMVAYLAKLSKNKYQSEIQGIVHKINTIGESIGEEQLTKLGRFIAKMAAAFCKAERKHKQEGFLVTYDNGWHSYNYNSGKGFYTGEYKGSIYSSGGANGWGCFTNTLSSTDSDTYYYTSLGRYIYVNNSCPMHGDGLALSYKPSENDHITISYGTWEQNEMKIGTTWNNDNVDMSLIVALSGIELL